jgi:hypothetical protein
MRRRTSTWRLLATIAAFVFTLAPSAVLAEEDFSERITATWQATDSKEEARRAINEEINELVAKMFFVKRPFARSQLKGATDPCAELTVAADDENVSIICNGKKPTITEGKGEPKKWVSREGEEYTITQKLEDDRIVQTFDSGGGVRTNVYRLKDDETMVLDVTVESGKLPEPLTYTRTFRKK